MRQPPSSWLGAGPSGTREDLRPRLLEHRQAPAHHVVEERLFVRAPVHVAPGLRQPELVGPLGIEIDVGLCVRQHLAVGRELDERRIAGLDRRLVRLSEAADGFGPAGEPPVLIVELRAEAARVAALPLVHERRQVRVVQKPFVVGGRLAPQALEQALDPAREVGDEVPAELAARVRQARSDSVPTWTSSAARCSARTRRPRPPCGRGPRLPAGAPGAGSGRPSRGSHPTGGLRGRCSRGTR